MESVATGLDLPNKILWPRSLFRPSKGLMLLGLGDIVIPGIFCALALRYDHKQSITTHNGNKLSFFLTPFFTATLSAYVLGLTMAMAMAHIFKAAQPALLYIRHVLH